MLKIQCPKCQTIYKLNENKIPLNGADVKCKVCENKFRVKGDLIKSNENLVLEKDSLNPNVKSYYKSKECPRCKSHRKRG